MKKLIFKLLTVNLLVFFVSCSNDNDFDKEQAVDSSKSIEKVVFDLGSGRSFGTSGTMLSFSSYEEYESTIQNLMAAVEAHEDAFFSQYDHLTGEEIDDIIDNVGFNEDQPLIDFENQLSFTNSKRKNLRELEDAWLLTDDLNPETDPNKGNKFAGLESTLLNEMGEVMIAGKVFSFDKIEYDYEILTDYANSLIKINNGDDVTNDPNINSISRSSGICRLAGHAEDYVVFPNDSRRRVKREMTFQHNNWGNLITKTIIISYRKRNNGRWRRSASPIGLINETNYNEAPCVRIDFKRIDNHSSTRKRRRREARISQNSPGNQFRIEQNAKRFKGTYYYGGTSSIKFY